MTTTRQMEIQASNLAKYEPVSTLDRYKIKHNETSAGAACKHSGPGMAAAYKQPDYLPDCL